MLVPNLDVHTDEDYMYLDLEFFVIEAGKNIKCSDLEQVYITFGDNTIELRGNIDKTHWFAKVPKSYGTLVFKGIVYSTKGKVMYSLGDYEL